MKGIPIELTKLRQWAVSTGGDSATAKAPFNPVTGKYVKVNDASTYVSYEDTCTSSYPLKGYILTKEDPYTIIDLDCPEDEEQAERHKKILESFDTYAEVSTSGKGVHIICRGSIDAALHRDNVEVYDCLRYMITTGNTLKPLPINDCQKMLDVLFSEMKPSDPTSVDDGEECWMSDATLVDKAIAAANGDKFISLCKGNIHEYQSQSEADLALMSILCFYSRDNSQVKEIFRCTELGKRDKATRNDTYLNRCITRIRKNEIPLVNFGNVDAITPVPTHDKGQGHSTPCDPHTTSICPMSTYTTPPGVLGEITSYITNSSTRPVKQIGLVAALAFLAGIVGRNYNISGTGLNQYIILMAPTGTGKEGATSGIDRLFAALRKTVPAVDDFQGPAAFASGQALVRHMSEKPCFASVLGEFGLMLKRLSCKNIAPADITLKQALLDLYQKSGWNSTLKSSVYSDKEKNSSVVRAPALTILGESTPEALLEGLSVQMIADGLLPRFITIEYVGARPARNKGAFFAPDAGLLSKLENIVLTVLAMQSNECCYTVSTSDAALKLLDDFDLECDSRISKSAEVYKHLWNRAHLKALKLSGLAAVADNCSQPVVTEEHATWAIELVRNDLRAISKRFEDNDVGDNEVRFESLLRKAIEDYAEIPTERRIKSYTVPRAVAEDPTVVPYPFLRRRFRLLPAFVSHKAGVKAAIKLCLDDCVEAGILMEVPHDQAKQKFNTSAKLYTKGPSWGK